MDVESLYTEDLHSKGAEMRVKDQFGEDLDMYITIAGLDSTAYKKAVAKMKREMLEDVDADEARRDALVAVTLSWRGFTSKGEDIEFSSERALELYKNAPYIVDQADNFLTKRVNFMPSKDA